MNKFVPPEKRSKKEQRALNLMRRKDWHGVDHSTKVIDSAVIYNRRRAKEELRRAADM